MKKIKYLENQFTGEKVIKTTNGGYVFCPCRTREPVTYDSDFLNGNTSDEKTFLENNNELWIEKEQPINIFDILTTEFFLESTGDVVEDSIPVIV